MLENIKVTEIHSVYTAYHKEGNLCEVQNRFAYGLSFAASGKIVYRKDGKTVIEDTSHAVLLPMGESYHLKCIAEGHFPLVNFISTEALGKEILSFPFSRHGTFTEKFHSLREAFFAYGGTARAMSLLYDILDELSRENASIEHRAVSVANNYVLSHFTDPDLTAESLARIAGVSEAYLRRLFGNAYGVSPKAYLQSVRLRRAKELLSLGFQSVGEIAEECGYASIYHFCRAFKLETGMTPKEYAKRYPVRNL